MKTMLSFGAGVQTTAMLVLIADGRLPRPDVIVFSDTGSEKPETYDYLREVSDPYAKRNGLEIIAIGADHRAPQYGVDLESYCLRRKMLPGTWVRWCTVHYKIDPLKTYRRRVLAATAKTPVESWIGISTDEARRAVPAVLRDEIKRYPLIELGISRADCGEIIQKAGLPLPPKSGCWFCPFQRRSDWQRMKRQEPEHFDRALAMERNAARRKGGELRYLPMFGSLEAVAAQDELPGFDAAIAAEGECVAGSCFV